MENFDISPEELRVFFQEAEEQLQVLEDGLVRLEHESGAHELVNGVFRAAHTLKGSSATIGLASMANLTHAMENVLDQLRHGQRSPNRQTIDTLLEGVDRLRSIVSTAGADLPSANAVDTSDLVERLRTSDTLTATPTTGSAELPSTKEDGPGEGSRPRITVRLDPGPWSGVRALQALLAIEAIAPIVDSRPTRDVLEQGQPVDVLEVQLQGAVADLAITTALTLVPDIAGVELHAPIVIDGRQPELPSTDPRTDHGTSTTAPAVATSSPLAHTVRVDVARLDSLMALAGELVVARNRLAQLARQVEAELPSAALTEGLAETTQHLERVTDQLQEEVMKSRLLPMRLIFQRLPRLVRDLSSKLGKEIDLQLEGEETQLDRSVMEEITDPILHLVRNAVDHGIETPEEREQRQKPRAGQLRVTAGQLEGWIVVTVEEDGRGIDLDRVKDKAVALGVISAEQAARLDDADAAKLVFAPGLSTASEVSEVSGRGVGMDVVRANVERINGSVAVETRLGQGTHFTLRLPLTLAITRALLVAVSDTIYAIPLATVGEAVRVHRKDIQALGRTDAIILRGQTVPLLWLTRIFGLGEAALSSDVLVVTVLVGSHPVGLVVDSLLGTQELVVKPLTAMVRHLPSLAGATTLGDGQVALILDPVHLGRELTAARSVR